MPLGGGASPAIPGPAAATLPPLITIWGPCTQASLPVVSGARVLVWRCDSWCPERSARQGSGAEVGSSCEQSMPVSQSTQQTPSRTGCQQGTHSEPARQGAQICQHRLKVMAAGAGMQAWPGCVTHARRLLLCGTSHWGFSGSPCSSPPASLPSVALAAAVHTVRGAQGTLFTSAELHDALAVLS